MERSPIVIGLAGVFGGMTALLLALTVVLRDPVVLVLAVTFAVVTGFFWYHASGRIREGIHERARRQRRARESGEGRGGFGAGPRFGDADSRFGREARERQGARQAGARRTGPGADGRARAGGRGPRGQRLDPDTPTRREAYRTLGLEPGADDDAVRHAYRERVKEVHPDRGGDEEAFQRVNRAYDRLR